ncbi:MAG TPA: metallophosphoesterase [Sphingobacteriaceae bacterium]
MGARTLSLILTSILLLVIDFYIFYGLRSIRKKWNARINVIFNYAWWGWSVLLILAVFLGMYFNARLTIRSIALVAFFITFVSKLVFLPFLFIDDIRRLFIWGKRKATTAKKATESPADAEKISRSEFLLKAGIAVAAVPFTSLTWGIASGAYDYQIRRQKLHLKNLPKAFDGMKIAQLSDIHSGSFYNRRAVLGGVEMLLKEKPDMAFFTGDIVNNLASEMTEYQDIFSKVRAPLGVYSVLGNHDYGEYYFGPAPSAAKAKNLEGLIATHKNMGWDLLMNENRRITVDGEEIAVIGIENWGGGRFPKFGRMDLAVQNTNDVPVKLLLSHDPSHWKAQVLKDYPQIDAMFSGHTHGMQFGVQTESFQWSPVQYVYDEWAGLYQQNDQQLYVNVGYGFLGYPGRVGILPEITIFELKQA